MFTGIVEELGTIKGIQKKGSTFEFLCDCHLVLEGTQVGDSIAVNGVCQTITEMDHHSIKFETIEDTLKVTNLGKLKIGEKVNLERALTLQKPLGGHLMSGHIDQISEIVDCQFNAQPMSLRIRIDEEMLCYVINKGSIAIDGISLTIQEIKNGMIRVGLINHTLRTTLLLYRKEGDWVNVEFDQIGKYILNFLQNQQKQMNKINKDKDLLDKLKTNGFI